MRARAARTYQRITARPGTFGTNLGTKKAARLPERPERRSPDQFSGGVQREEVSVDRLGQTDKGAVADVSDVGIILGRKLSRAGFYAKAFGGAATLCHIMYLDELTSVRVTDMRRSGI
jgi:hypothetical protein